MLGLVEIGDVNGLRDLADGILTHQHAAEHGHFRVVIMRGHAVENRGRRAAADVCVPPPGPRGRHDRHDLGHRRTHSDTSVHFLLA